MSFAMQFGGATLLAPVVLPAAALWPTALWVLVLASIALALAGWSRGHERARRAVIHFLWVPMLLGIAVLFT